MTEIDKSDPHLFWKKNTSAFTPVQFVRYTSVCVYFVVRAVASLTVPDGQEFHFFHLFLKFQLIFLIFPQTLLIFFLIFSQPHSPGWARVPLFSPFPQISIDFSDFSSNFSYFLPHFGPLGGRLAHLGRPWYLVLFVTFYTGTS